MTESNDLNVRKVDEDVEVVKAKLDMEECMRKAIEAGKSKFGQIFEIYRLSRASGQLSANDYYYFQLYDDSQFTFEDKTRFGSEKFGNYLITKTNDVDWHCLSCDKFKAYAHLQQQGFPIPETQAVLYEREREFDGVPKLDSPEALRTFLETEARFPMYAKPVFGIGSIGNFLIEEFVDDEVFLHDGSSMSLEAFYRKVEPKHAYLLQSLLTPHKDVTAISPRISTVRLVFTFQEGRPNLIHSLWKIPSADSIADNYWRKGNMLANVMTDTGTIDRVVRGTGPWMDVLESHPDTGMEFHGFEIPFWSEIVDMATEGAKAFSPLRYQSWDIGISPDGPVVVEVNSGSALGLAQLAQGRGFLTDEFLMFLDEHGCKLKKRPAFNRKKRTASFAALGAIDHQHNMDDSSDTDLLGGDLFGHDSNDDDRTHRPLAVFASESDSSCGDDSDCD